MTIAVISEQLKGLTTLMNSQFINVHERLDKIETQTTRTNGRVTQLEKDGITHYVACPVKADVEEIKTSLLEYNFFKKYPKVFIGLIIFMICGMGGGMYASYNKINHTGMQNKVIIQRIDSLAKVNNIQFKDLPTF